MGSHSNSEEPGLVDGFDPDLLDAVMPSVTGAWGPEALLALLRERGDPRLNGIAELFRAECPWPVPDPSQGRIRLATGRVCGGGWEIELTHPAWELVWSCYVPEAWDYEAPTVAHEDMSDGWNWFAGNGADGPPIAARRISRRVLEAGFADCKRRIALLLLEVHSSMRRQWVAVVRGDLSAALHALRWAYDPDIRIYEDPNLKWAARWLIAIARLHPARQAALMAGLWAVPRLHRAGYQVLGVTHPGWTELLPEFAPPDAVEEVADFVRRGAPRRACKLLDAVAPGWQADLGRATGLW